MGRHTAPSFRAISLADPVVRRVYRPAGQNRRLAQKDERATQGRSSCARTTYRGECVGRAGNHSDLYQHPRS